MRTLVLLLFVAACLPAAEWKLIVGGLGGEPEYETRFAAQAAEAAKLLAASSRSVPVLPAAKAAKYFTR